MLKFQSSVTSKENFLHFLLCTLFHRWCIYLCVRSVTMSVSTHMGLALTGALTQMLENESGPTCVFLTFICTRFLVDIVNSDLEAHHHSRTLIWRKAQVFIFTIYWFFAQKKHRFLNKIELLLRARLGRGYLTNKISSLRKRCEVWGQPVPLFGKIPVEVSDSVLDP